ncbi:unnamed protein product [Caenorhabditis bovis]|uniref:Uncharacterized protein n=1 Tax=Caenorhabditis bovis TaxID=2654633 RepID=A0A8S1F979_9PELO|nr:unnamed protein product [Caenorhabditis bovis]
MLLSFTYSLLLVVIGANAKRRTESSMVNSWSVSDCVRPWQIPQMSKATLQSPSRPIECHPDHHNCPSGRNPVCQYSLRALKYVCCEDKKEAEIPSCPKYYDTLLISCGSSVEGSCPRGYKCMGSMTDVNLKLCCKPNRTLTYKEPESTFRENKIVPKFLPLAPKTELLATFGNEKISMGQLFDASQLDLIADPPVMTAGVELKDDRLYTIILVDSSDRPVGVHILVLALFEQLESFSQRNLGRIAGSDFTFSEFINDHSDIIEERPLAATFFGYSTTIDDRFH